MGPPSSRPVLSASGHRVAVLKIGPGNSPADPEFLVEAMGLEPTNLLTASQALYQLSYAPSGEGKR
jgi:hypothetical protein